MMEKIEQALREIEERIQYTEKNLIEQIKEKIKCEREKETFTIYVGLQHRKEIERESGFYEIGNYKWIDGVLERILSYVEEDTIQKDLFSIYIEESYSKILSIMEENKKYKGFFIDTDGKQYPFEYRLAKNTSYQYIEKEIEKFFFENNMIPIPVFNPYVRKMFDVILDTEYETVLENLNGANIEKIDLGQLEQDYNIKIDFVPIWNVQLKTEMIHYSVVPVKDRKLFCVETMESEDTTTLYKNDQTYIDHIEKIKENKNSSMETYKLYFKDNVKEWDLCKIKNVEYKELIDRKSDIFSCKFDNSVSEIYGKTKYEITKKIKGICGKLEIKFIEYYTQKEQLQEVARYISTFQYPNNKKAQLLEYSGNRMNIYMKVKKEKDYLFEDKINYLISYMTSIYPEMNWKGVYDE